MQDHQKSRATETPCPADHGLATIAALLGSGQSIAQSSFELIESAQKEIVWTEFLLRDDEFGLMKLALIRRKAREGKRVILHVDAFHLFADWALIRHLINEGVEITVFNEFTLSGLAQVSSRNHNKALIVDGEVYKTGDSNTGNEYVQWGNGRHMKSIDIVLGGSVARDARSYAFEVINCPLSKVPDIQVASIKDVEYQRRQLRRMTRLTKNVFDSLFIQLDAAEQISRPSPFLVTNPELEAAHQRLDQAFRRYSMEYRKNPARSWIAGASPIDAVHFFSDMPQKTKDSAVTRAVAGFIGEARERVTIVSPYLILTPPLKEALKCAMARGARVLIFTNSMHSTDNFTTQLAYEYRLEEISQLGPLEIFEYHGDETLHAKFVLRDQSDCMLMTYNLDWRSDRKNLETAVQFSGQSIYRELEAWLFSQKEKFLCATAHGQLWKQPVRAQSPTEKMKRVIIQAIEKQL